MEQPGKLIIEPIGVVHNEIQESRDASFDWSGITSQIKLEDSYFNYTRGLEEYSHIWVIFWINRASKKELVAEIHPKGDQTCALDLRPTSRIPASAAEEK